MHTIRWAKIRIAPQRTRSRLPKLRQRARWSSIHHWPKRTRAMADSLAIGDWNWTESKQEFKRSIELDPNISYTHLAYAGSYLTAAGRPDEVVSESERALELEPVSLINNTVTASSLVYDRKFDRAL